MCLKDLIELLEAEDPDMVVPFGFHNPHSYRGYYNCLAFEPCANITVGEMLSAARSAVGSTYDGWKGGEYLMNNDTDVYLAYEGCGGEELSRTLMEFILGRIPQVEP